MLAPGKAEVKPSDFPPHSSMSVKSKIKNLPKKLDLSSIPTFVPRNAMGSEELVWSPTSGTRQRRPDETYQQKTNARPANPIQSGQEIHPNLTSAYNLRNQYLFHGDRDFSDSPSKNHRHSDSIMRTPPPQFKSTLSPLNPSAASSSRSKENLNPRRKRRNNLEDTPFSDSVDRMMEMATMKHDPNSKNSPPSHYDTTAYPVEDLTRPTSPSQFRGPRYPSNQVRGVYDAEPFSAPSSVLDYGRMHQTGRGMYGGSPSPFQGQLGPFRPGSDTASFYPSATYAPDPQIWSTNHSPRPRRGALPNQMPNQIIQPIPQMMSQAQMPRFMGQAQMPPSMAQVPNSETLSVPPQGYMDPLDYWNMLHQRETEIRTRLQNANRPMTDQERQYISLLGEARINTVATQMPARGSMSKGKWLRELGRTLRSIWKTGPGGTGFHPVIVARKEDYEKAIEREIERTSQERERRKFGSALDHAYGA